MTVSATPAASLTPMEAFPPEPELEHEQSELNIPLLVDGEVQEMLRLTSLLKMNRGTPITNAAGYRQFEFEITEWEVAGFSEVLGEWVTITLADTPQPRSVCVSQTAGVDYPAIITYSAVYDVYVGKQRTEANVTGLGVGVDVMTIPPRNHVHFQKAFGLGEGVEAINGQCQAMETVLPDNWEEMAAEFRSYRA